MESFSGIDEKEFTGQKKKKEVRDLQKIISMSKDTGKGNSVVYLAYLIFVQIRKRNIHLGVCSARQECRLVPMLLWGT